MANFLSATANFEDFINMSSAEINGHVQKNNESVLKKAFNFSSSTGSTNSNTLPLHIITLLCSLLYKL